jgi:exonuclease III
MAWNVGGLRAFLKSRIADLQQAVKLGAPDVFGIMEHKLTDSQLALEFAGKNVEL